MSYRRGTGGEEARKRLITECEKAEVERLGVFPVNEIRLRPDGRYEVEQEIWTKYVLLIARKSNHTREVELVEARNVTAELVRPLFLMGYAVSVAPVSIPLECPLENPLYVTGNDPGDEK